MSITMWDYEFTIKKLMEALGPFADRYENAMKDMDVRGFESFHGLPIEDFDRAHSACVFAKLKFGPKQR